MDEEWQVVGANKKVRPSQEHKELEHKYNVRGLANTLASTAAANLEKQGFKFYTVEKAPATPPQDKSNELADYTYLSIKDNRYGDYAGFMRWKEDKPVEPETETGFYSIYGPGFYSDGKFYNLQSQCEDDDDE